MARGWGSVMSADWDGRAEGLTRVKSSIVRATVHVRAGGGSGAERREPAGRGGGWDSDPGPGPRALLSLERLLLLSLYHTV